MTQKPELSPEKRRALLQESLKAMTFAENVARKGDAAPPEGWRVVAVTGADGGKETEGLTAKVYERIGDTPPGEKKYMVAFRGTDDMSEKGGDLNSNMSIAFRRVPGQFWQALEFVENVCRENNINPSDMGYTGHSLGGYLARTVGTTLGAKNIWTFNSPGPSEAVLKDLSNYIPGLSAPPGDGLVQVRSKNDFVSLWGRDEGVMLTVDTTHDHHGLKGLREGVTAAASGQALAPDTKKGLSLSRVFNEAGKRLANSGIINAAIDRLIASGHKKPVPSRPPAIV